MQTTLRSAGEGFAASMRGGGLGSCGLALEHRRACCDFERLRGTLSWACGEMQVMGRERQAKRGLRATEILLFHRAEN